MKIAYNIAGAAKVAAVSEQVIVQAGKSQELMIRRVDDKAVILSTDIQEWLEKQHRY